MISLIYNNFIFQKMFQVTLKQHYIFRLSLSKSDLGWMNFMSAL